RKNPLLCAHVVYSTGRCILLAISDAILFSNPSSLLFVNGRLLGSAHTRNAACDGGIFGPGNGSIKCFSAITGCSAFEHADTNIAAVNNNKLRKRKHIQRASFRSCI